MKPAIYIFAGGGTGGHVCPGLAVADELVRRSRAARIVFACSNREIDRRILDPLEYGIVPQPVRPLPRRLGQVWPFLRAWRSSLRLAADMVADLKPAAVLGLGGFAAAPVVRKAARAGVPTALLNPDALPGRANLHLARRVDAIFTQFDSSADHFPAKVRSKVRCTGCPVRGEILTADRDEAMRHFELDAGRKTLLVLGGSLGAANINEGLAELAGDLDALADTWQVLHITGPAKGQTDAGGHGGGITVRTVEYCHRMDLAYSAADVVLCRAGANTVAELSATGTPAVLMPYPYHADDHQRLNAAALVETGAGVICEDTKDASANAAALRESLLPILREDSRMSSMRAAAGCTAKPRAAAEVAKWLAQAGQVTAE